jgi:hypothetical protein
MDDSRDMYLCQVSESVSCGACCGLYNVPDLSRENLERLLSERTKAFASVPRTENGIYDFLVKNEGPLQRARPFPEFHHCPFLGFVGEEKSRVGCLLHPSVHGNNGVDYRSLSWYGEQACRTYFCPATKKLVAVYQSILIQTLDNWYDFGLLVTEHCLVRAYFMEVESRLGRHVTESDFTQNFRAADALREFAELKSKWPYRRDDSYGPCNFFFENGLYPRPSVFRSNPDIRLSSNEVILRELDSGFSSAKEIEEADKALDDLFSKTVRGIESINADQRSNSNSGRQTALFNRTTENYINTREKGVKDEA